MLGVTDKDPYCGLDLDPDVELDLDPDVELDVYPDIELANLISDTILFHHSCIAANANRFSNYCTALSELVNKRL